MVVKIHASLSSSLKRPAGKMSEAVFETQANFVPLRWEVKMVYLSKYESLDDDDDKRNADLYIF